jgi:glycosyltransferase involved in cell wall biosynthesis
MLSESEQLTAPPSARVAPTSLRYVLITPARNEATFLEETIQCVVNQTQPPMKWIIVSDGSTDGTDDIVNRYAAEHPWIELVRMPERKERHFAGKVNAINAGRARVADLDYDVIGSMDADITVEEDYFRFLLQKFEENPRLGVAGTPFREGTRQYDYRFTSMEHVSGACQLFRKECFADIGGYRAIKTGGIDTIAVVTARMKGWETRSFLEKACYHHRPMGSAMHKGMLPVFKTGMQDYTHGIDPVWQLFRSLYQMTRKPFLLSGSLLLSGYFWAMISGKEIEVSPEFIRFRKLEHRRRLRDFFSSRLLGKTSSASGPAQP